MPHPATQNGSAEALPCANLDVTTVTSRAGNGTRTRDPNLGKVVLYQLSYSRVIHPIGQSDRGDRQPTSAADTDRDGAEGNRTPDLLNAIQALSQLSYGPVS